MFDPFFSFFFFFNDTATTEIYTTANTLSLTTLFRSSDLRAARGADRRAWDARRAHARSEEHTSELQSLAVISYAVFCLKKKNNIIPRDRGGLTTWENIYYSYKH